MVGGTDFEHAALQPRHQTATASPARRSSRSPSSRRSRTGIAPGRSVGRPRRSDLQGPEPSARSFAVHNFEDSYCGRRSRWRNALAYSDNSVFAEVGCKVGTHKIARLARTGWACKTPVSTNPAMTLGGLKEGVTPLEMAYAYSTIANERQARVRDRSRRRTNGPVAIDEGADGDGRRRRRRTSGATSAGRPDERRAAGDADHARRGHRAAPARARTIERVRRRQDRHHRELRRRLVRRLQRPATRSRSGSATRTG